MPFSFVWMLHGNDEGLDEDGKRRVAVNWVMPAGGPVPGQSPKLNGHEVFMAAGELMWPWRFEIDDWYAVDATGALQALSATGKTAAGDLHATYALLEAELYNRCAGCDDVFSLDPDYLRAGVAAPPRVRLPGDECARSSLPHVFTPLTHLPAALSQDVLGVVRGFSCQVLPGTLAYVPRFALDLGARKLRFVPATATPEIVNGAPVSAAVVYGAQYDDGQAYTDVEFSIVTNYAEEATDLASVGAAFHASDLSEVGARALLASNALSPLVMLGRAAPDGAGWPAAAASPEQVMARTLGPGLLRMDETGPVMIWERLPSADAHTGDDLLASWSDTNQPWLSLKAHYEADAGAGSPLLAALKPLFDAPSLPHRFASAAADLLDRAADARVLVVAWLSTVALEQARSKPSEVWVAKRSFAEWYKQIAPIVGEHEVAELQAGWWRHWVQLLSGSSDARVREMHAIADRWIRGRTDATDIDTLEACYAHGMALLASAGPGPADMPTSLVRDRIAALHGRLRPPDEAAPVSLGEDRDLAVVIGVDESKVKRQDEQLRGYAVAMAAGYDAPDARLDWQWVTDLAATIKNAQGDWEDFLGPDAKLLRCHDAFGAISEKGRTMVAFPYAGRALYGAMRTESKERADSDGVDGLAFGWPKAWNTPPLAYGLRYWARATPVGNAGKILDQQCARPGDDRRLKDPDADLFKGVASFRYLCRVTPGGVTIKPGNRSAEARAYQMETDARAWHEQAGVAPDRRIRVAVIRPDENGWRADAPTELAFDLIPPDGTPKLIERWIGADIAQRLARPADGPALRDPASAGRTPEELAVDRSALLGRFAARQGLERRARHPAARAIGVDVRFAHSTATLRAVLAPAARVERGYMDKAGIVSTAAKASAARVDGSTLRIELAPGDIARIRCWTLVPEQFFAAAGGPLARMAEFPSEYAGFGASYRAFGEREHWFECAPSAAAARAQSIAALEAVQDALRFVMDGHDAAARIAVAGGVDATWLKGFLVQRHDWHWTGYPLALPRTLHGTPGLHEWSEAFAGTESLVESRVETLQTQARPDWRFGLPDMPVELCRARLPGLHGARFVACVLRPLRRFDAWLLNDAAVENLVAATGKLVAARVDWNDPALRLAPPAVRAAIPLVRTYEATGAGVGKSGNGALLCLDDVLFRTDALARFGGVGEIVDVDLEETRINNVFEIGPNPIMHAGPQSSATVPPAAPGAPPDGVPLPELKRMDLPYSVHYLKDGSALPERTPMDWRVVADRPFGLTEDLDRNPKVARSAIVVRPLGVDVASYWVMAKVRLRRMLEPHLDWTANGALPREGDNWLLARRPEGDDRIPFDFAVSCDPAAPFRLKVANAPGVSFGPRPGKARRLLCSWHKGHWTGTSETLWGLQVLEQVLEQDVGQWTTSTRHSPYETTDATKGVDFKDPAPVLVDRPAGAAAQRLLLSDYGQAHWLTFIGMPWRHPSFANESCWMEKDGGALRLLRSGVGYGVEVISRDLLVNPLRPEHFGGTPGSERVAAEPFSFHLLLVFDRVDDIAAPAASNPLGQLAGVYYPTRTAISAAAPYPPLRFEPFMKGSTMRKGAVGYLYKFQSSGKNPESWEELLAGMFPEHGRGEATVRWLPELVGPIGTSEPVKAPHIDKGKIRIDVGALGKVDIKVDQRRGWELVSPSGSKNPWQKDVPGGSCTLAPAGGARPVLALEGGGGRLLAHLDGWEQGAGGAAWVYDENGSRSPGSWKPV